MQKIICAKVPPPQKRGWGWGMRLLGCFNHIHIWHVSPNLMTNTEAYSPYFKTRNSKVGTHRRSPKGVFKYSAHGLLVSYMYNWVYVPSLTLTTYMASSSDRFSNITAWSGIRPGSVVTQCNNLPGTASYMRIWKIVVVTIHIELNCLNWNINFCYCVKRLIFNSLRPSDAHMRH